MSSSAHSGPPAVAGPAHSGATTPDGAAAGGARVATVVVYSSHPGTRTGLVTALGRSPAPGLLLDFVEAGRGEEVVRRCDEGGVDLVILDGESAPTGGIGLCRQLKDELDDPPPVLLVVGRRDDAWLATWSRAEGVISHPVDAVQAARAVAALLGTDPVPAATSH
jgi:DNA-binding NarL/FixJ family response regulator